MAMAMAFDAMKRGSKKVIGERRQTSRRLASLGRSVGRSHRASPPLLPRNAMHSIADTALGPYCIRAGDRAACDVFILP